MCYLNRYVFDESVQLLNNVYFIWIYCNCFVRVLLYINVNPGSDINNSYCLG